MESWLGAVFLLAFGVGIIFQGLRIWWNTGVVIDANLPGSIITVLVLLTHSIVIELHGPFSHSASQYLIFAVLLIGIFAFAFIYSGRNIAFYGITEERLVSHIKNALAKNQLLYSLEDLDSNDLINVGIHTQIKIIKPVWKGVPTSLNIYIKNWWKLPEFKLLMNHIENMTKEEISTHKLYKPIVFHLVIGLVMSMLGLYQMGF